jgi:phosphoglycolate phosphatase
MKRYKVLFVDLDNTLYDWLSYFAPALRGMCVKLSEMSDIALGTLLSDFRRVFIAHRTVEYSFALQELDSLKKKHPRMSGEEIVEEYRPALDVFQHRRRDRLHLYPEVAETLRAVTRLGISIVAMTDAHGFHASMRLRQLKIRRLIDGLVCRPDHQVVSAEQLSKIRRFPAEYYDYDIPRYVLPEDLRKPDPATLNWAMDRLDVKPSQCVFVGDNLVKDVQMAQRASVIDCWAEYGTRFDPADLATLVRVTHWPREAVRAVVNPTPESLGVYPTYTLKRPSDLIYVLTDPQIRRPDGRTIAGYPTSFAEDDSENSLVGVAVAASRYEIGSEATDV